MLLLPEHCRKGVGRVVGSDCFNAVTHDCLQILLQHVVNLFTRLEFPYAQFATTALAGDLLFDPFWEAVRRLEVCGFKVVAATADGATPNRTFFRIHCEKGKESELLYRTPNPFSVEDRYIFFFSDPLHLLKTARNCWASKKRHMWVST